MSAKTAKGCGQADKECPTCEGGGRIQDAYWTCGDPECCGYGDIECEACAGTGRIPCTITVTEEPTK